jgi:hypothetical protein
MSNLQPPTSNLHPPPPGPPRAQAALALGNLSVENAANRSAVRVARGADVLAKFWESQLGLDTPPGWED